jgi:NADPH:quinone reductase-like Zn-dependent oxidoreductase
MRGIRSNIDLFTLFQKKAIFRGIGAVAPRRAFEEMNKALVKLKLRPVIDAVYPFTDAVSAFRHLELGAFGKIVIRIHT